MIMKEWFKQKIEEELEKQLNHPGGTFNKIPTSYATHYIEGDIDLDKLAEILEYGSEELENK